MAPAAELAGLMRRAPAGGVVQHGFPSEKVRLKLQGELVEGIFGRRVNRFAAEVEVAGRAEVVHVPNSGRMRELLVAGAGVLLAAKSGPRKTAYDLTLVRYEERWVGVDARLPTRLLEEAIWAGLPDLGPFGSLRREVVFGESRLDFAASGTSGPCLIEVKSVNLVRDGVALFPDAPTLRGVRHLEELRRAMAVGYCAVVVFVVQRDDAVCLRPFEEADPLFAATLREVCPPVLVLAYSCVVGRDEMRISSRIPVEVEPH